MSEHIDPALKALHHEESTLETFDQVQHIKQNLTIVDNGMSILQPGEDQTSDFTTSA